MNRSSLILIIFTILACPSFALKNYTVPFGGNAWAKGGSITSDGFLFDAGLSVPSTCSLYAYVSGAGNASLMLNLGNIASGINISVQIGSSIKTVSAPASEISKDIAIGDFPFAVGYTPIVVTVTGAIGNISGIIADAKVSGLTDGFEISNFVMKPADFNTGRVGFGVGVKFISKPFYKGNLVYAEIMIPIGSDISGTNFYALQYNSGFVRFNISETGQRFISFSQISVDIYTQNANDIAPAYQVKTNAKGIDVGLDIFGGQNIYNLAYNWQAGVTYKVVIKNNYNTGTLIGTYSAWFFDPLVSDWIFLATAGALTVASFGNLKSSIELTSTENGNLPRSLLLKRIVIGQFQRKMDFLTGEVDITTNTNDTQSRRDVFVGVDETGANFLLKTCGFFNETTVKGTQVTRAIATTALDFSFLVPFKYQPVTLSLGTGFTNGVGSSISASGFNFTKLPASVNTYVYAVQEGPAALSLSIPPHNNNLVIKVCILNRRISLPCASSIYQRYFKIGIFRLQAGYNKIDITLSSDGSNNSTNGALTSINLVPLDENLKLKYYVTNPQFFHDWRLAGASLIEYLRLDSSSEGIEYIQYLYVEMTIPIQPLKNLFNFIPVACGIGLTRLSVTDNGTKTIEFIVSRESGQSLDQRILQDYYRGTNVTANINESILNLGPSIHVAIAYDWQFNTAYKFISQASPSLETNKTIYRSWFYDPLISKWILIASVEFDIYAFMEIPFSMIFPQNPDAAQILSIAEFGNVWIVDDQGKSYEASKANFNQELAAIHNEVAYFRRDQWGGVNRDQTKFVLGTGAFTNRHTDPEVVIQRKTSGKAFPFDISSLPLTSGV